MSANADVRSLSEAWPGDRDARFALRSGHRRCQLRTHAPQQIALYSINSSASSKADSEMVSPSA